MIEIVIFLMLSFFFSLSEACLLALTYPKIKALASAEKRFEILEKIKKKEQALLVFILIVNNIANIFVASLSTKIVLTTFGERAFGLGLILVTAIIILFSEIIPKTLATKMSDRVKAKVLYFLSYIYIPVRGIAELIVEKLQATKENAEVSEEEVEEMIKLGELTGEFTKMEREIILGTFEFTDKVAEEVMIPLQEVFWVEGDLTLEELLEKLKKEKIYYSRIPIKVDEKFVGFVNLKQAILQGIPKETKLKNIVSEALHVFRYEPLPVVFERMKKTRRMMGFVYDSVGAMLGIITMEDLIEEIFGEIYEEYEREKKRIWRLRNKWYFYSTIDMSTLERVLGVDLGETNIREFIEKNLRKIPKEGESFVAKGFQFQIEKVGKRKYLISARKV